MPLLVTPDASVLIASAMPNEPGRTASLELLRRLDRRSVPVILPTLAPAELAGALARRLDDPILARSVAASLVEAANVTLVPLDVPLAAQAADLAAQLRLRGADAVYLAVALRFGGVLVTLDQQQAERARATVRTLTPAEALAEPDLS